LLLNASNITMYCHIILVYESMNIMKKFQSSTMGRSVPIWNKDEW